MAVPIPSLDLKISTEQTQQSSVTGADVSGGSSGVSYGDYTPGTSKVAWIIAGAVGLAVLVLYFVFRRK